MSRAVQVRFRILPQAEGLESPARATAGSAGFDLRAAVDDAVVIAAGDRAKIPTGLVLEIPQGYEAQVRPTAGWHGSRGSHWSTHRVRSTPTIGVRFASCW